MGFQGYQCRRGNQIPLLVSEGLLCLLGPLELVLFLEELKEWESPDAESRDEPAQGSHTPHQLLEIMEVCSFILVMADTFFGLGTIPRWGTIYPSNFAVGTLKVHF
jgi:hypothetical protein